MKAIVYPIITTEDYIYPDPPLAIERDTKKEALKALRKRGYRIMWVGGSFDSFVAATSELRELRCADPAVMKALRSIVGSLDDDLVVVYKITVWPKG